MLLKDSAMESANFYLKKWRGVRCLFKSPLLADLLGSQYLLEILQSSLTVKNNENGVKSGCFEKLLRWRAPIFFRNEGKI